MLKMPQMRCDDRCLEYGVDNLPNDKWSIVQIWYYWFDNNSCHYCHVHFCHIRYALLSYAFLSHVWIDKSRIFQTFLGENISYFKYLKVDYFKVFLWGKHILGNFSYLQAFIHLMFNSVQLFYLSFIANISSYYI